MEPILTDSPAAPAADDLRPGRRGRVAWRSRSGWARRSAWRSATSSSSSWRRRPSCSARRRSLVAACAMGLTGRLTGLILLVFEDRSGLALVDLLMHQPVGTTTAWGELEAVGRQGDDQHRRLRLCQCPGRAPARQPAGGNGSRRRAGPHAADVPARVRRQPARVRPDGAGHGAGPGCC